MNTARRFSFFLTPLALYLTACGSSNVYTSASPGVKIKDFATYAWIPKPTESPRDDLAPEFRPKMRAAIKLALAEKGYIKVEPDQDPDFYVVFYVNLALETRVWVSNWGYRAQPWSGKWGYACDPAFEFCDQNAAIEAFGVGTLVIDLVDRNMSALLWRGWAKDVVYPNSAEDRLLAAGQKIMERLPTSGGKKKPTRKPLIQTESSGASPRE